MTTTQIPADIAADIASWQAMADNTLLSDDDRLAWTRLVAATKAMVRGDMNIAAAHLLDSLTANPDILDDIASR